MNDVKLWQYTHEVILHNIYDEYAEKTNAVWYEVKNTLKL